MEKQMLPSGWEQSTLGEICLINPRRPRIDREDDKPTSFVPMAAVDETLGVISDLQTRPYSEVRRGYTYFEENDVLFAKITPSMQNGKSAIARGLNDGIGLGSTEFHVLRPQERVIPEWVHLFVRQLGFRMEAVQHFRGAVGQQRVPPEFLETHLIPVPPSRDIQRRIVTRIEALLAEVREARQIHRDIVEDTDQVMDAVLEETVTQLYESFPCLTIKQLKNQNTLNILGGGTPSKRNSEYWGGSVLWASPKDAKSWIITDTQDHITLKAVEESSVKLIPRDSVLVVVRGMILARIWPVAIAGTELTINQDMKALIPSNSLDSKYLGYVLRGLTQKVLDRVETAAHGTKRLKTPVLEALEIPLPSKPEQDRITAYLDSVQTQVQAMQELQTQDGQALELVEQAILDKAFRGEL